MSKTNNRIPKKWKKQYDDVVVMRAMNCSYSQIANTLPFSISQVKRIAKMPQFKEKLKEVTTDDDGGDIVSKARAKLRELIPRAVEVYGEVMNDDEAHNRDRLSAADSTLDRGGMPKWRREQVETMGDGIITINLNVSKEELLESPGSDSTYAWLESPTQEAEYSIICSECKTEYKPGIGHECEPTSLTLPHHQPPKGY